MTNSDHFELRYRDPKPFVGRRVPSTDKGIHDVETTMANGAYVKIPEDHRYYGMGIRWLVSYGTCGALREGVHTVEEHDDGTITVSPSLVMPASREGERWHGWLRHGVFEDGQWELRHAA